MGLFAWGLCVAVSAFNYLTPARLAELDLTVSGVTDETLAAQHISAAERIIDSLAGPWPCFYPTLTGNVEGSSINSITSKVFGQNRIPNYWAIGGHYLETFDGTGAGQKLQIASSSGQTVTFTTNLDSAVDSTTHFILRQLSRFPRFIDWDLRNGPRLPEGLEEAVAAQVSYMVRVGSEAFGPWDAKVIKGDRGNIVSESYGSGYSLTRDVRRDGQGPFADDIAPRARMLLRGYGLITSLGRLRIFGRQRAVHGVRTLGPRGDF